MKVIFIFLFPLLSFAHDLQVKWQKEGRAVIIQSAYAGSDASSYASVEIFDPSGSKTEFQNGRTDARGFFMDDEMGHRVETQIDLTDVADVALSASSQPPWQKALTGLSVIFGFTGFIYGWKARRKS